MNRFLPGIVTFGLLASFAYGQSHASSDVTSPSITLADETPATTGDQPDVALDPASLLPDLPALPPAKATLIGGSVEKLDRVEDALTLRVFGGGKMKIVFDTRTRFYRDGVEASVSDLRPGERVYVDTILNGDTVFAKNIRVKSGAPAGESQGVVVSYHAGRGELLLRDRLSPKPLTVRITPSTRVTQGNKALSASSLEPGTLVAVRFAPQKDGRDVAGEISVLAAAGANFTFVGQIVSLDLRAGLLALVSSTDHKTYDIYLDPAASRIDENLHVGADITAQTRFDGGRYIVRQITVNAASAK